MSGKVRRYVCGAAAVGDETEGVLEAPCSV